MLISIINELWSEWMWIIIVLISDKLTTLGEEIFCVALCLPLSLC